MVKKLLGAFDATVNLAYKGAKKLFWVTVAVAIIVSVFTVLIVAGIYAVVK